MDYYALYVTNIIHLLRRRIFGTSSQRVTREIEQLELKLDELEAARAARDVAEAVSIASSSRPAWRPLPEHLTREVHTCLPAEEFCPACGDQLRTLGEDVSEVLEYIPASFKVIRQVRQAGHTAN